MEKSTEGKEFTISGRTNFIKNPNFGSKTKFVKKKHSFVKMFGPIEILPTNLNGLKVLVEKLNLIKNRDFVKDRISIIEIMTEIENFVRIPCK